MRPTKRKHVLPFILFLIYSIGLSAQTADEETTVCPHIELLFDSLRASDNDSLSLSLSKQIDKELGLYLASDDSSFYAPLNELKYLGKCYSDDGELRIYTWSFPLSDKTYGYGGYLQLKPTKKRTKNKVKPIRLSNNGTSYLPKTGMRIASTKWYGALYYNAIATKKNGEDYYILLGWAGNDAVSDFKIVETLKFQNNEKSAMFGAVSPFQGGGKTTNRIVLQFNNNAKVALNYDAHNKQIIMDHLSPSDPFYKGIYSYYGPDFTYDAYQYDKKEKGIWKLQENIDAKNKD